MIRWIAKRLVFAGVLYLVATGLAYNLVVFGVVGW